MVCLCGGCASAEHMLWDVVVGLLREAHGAITAMVACRYWATHSVRVALGDVAAGSATDPDASLSAVASSWQPSSAAAFMSALRGTADWLA